MYPLPWRGEQEVANVICVGNIFTIINNKGKYNNVICGN